MYARMYDVIRTSGNCTGEGNALGRIVGIVGCRERERGRHTLESIYIMYI